MGLSPAKNRDCTAFDSKRAHKFGTPFFANRHGRRGCTHNPETVLSNEVSVEKRHPTY